MSNENEFGFTPDTPEAYQAAEAAGTENEFGVVNDAPLPPADDIDDEEPAGDLPPTPPVAPVAQVAPAPVAQVAPAAENFDRRSAIQGLREDVDTSVEGVALATKIKLSKEPKVRMMIPLDPGEKAGAYRTVVINGYRFDVRKNTMVDLPQSVASLLADAYQITSDVLENNPLNLNRASSEAKRALGMA